MVGLSGAGRVMLATRPVDFHKGMDGPAAQVARHDGRGSVLRHGLHVPVKTRRPGEAPGLGWKRAGPRGRAFAGWSVLFAEDPGRREPAERGATHGLVGSLVSLGIEEIDEP